MMVAQIDKNYIRTRPTRLWSRLLSYALFEGRPLTTRGQWINPLVFAHFALEKRLPQLKRVEKPVFILGTGRSGTTILGIVLSMHHEVGFLNEPKALWHALRDDEDLIGSYSRGPAKYRLGKSDAQPHVIQNAHKLFGAYLRATMTKRVVDKYPELIFRVPFVKAIFSDAKFLFLVRNGWDTCHSIGHWSERLGQDEGGEVHDWWGAERRKWNLLVEQLVPGHPDLAPHAGEMKSWTNQRDMAAVEWIITMREGLRLLRDFPNDVMRVDYEAICENPIGSMESITDYLGLASGDYKFLQYAKQTLVPTCKKTAFEINPLIEESFNRTMTQLGYSE